MQNSRRLFPIFFSFFEFRPIEQAKYFCICLPNDRPIAVDISVGYFHICVDVVQCLVYGVFVDFERGRTGYRCPAVPGGIECDMFRQGAMLRLWRRSDVGRRRGSPAGPRLFSFKP